MNLGNILLTPSHFHLTFNAERTDRMLDFYEIPLPSYHPSMEQTGIPFEYVPNLMGGVIDGALEELDAVAEKSGNIILTDSISPALQENKNRSLSMQRERQGLMVEGIPLISCLYIGSKTINPYGSNGDYGIRMDSRRPDSFVVPERVIFDRALMDEYQMTDEGALMDNCKRIGCPYLFRRHNLENFNAIFYRHLIIALDNEVVRRKYFEEQDAGEN